MTKFKADNTMPSAWDAFYFRSLYKKESFMQKKPQVRDFTFAEDVLYGRVDTRLNTIYPREEMMVTAYTDGNTEATYRLIDFVADAFSEVSRAMRHAKEMGTIPDDEPIFSKFEPKKTYESPFVLYDTYIDNLMDDYFTDFLENKGYRKKVITFKQFIKYFVMFLSQRPHHTPFTFTSWQRSKTSNIFTSGIAVDIGGLAYGRDQVIERNVLKSKCFPYYLNVCLQNGFLVSKTAPTLMVADILSPGLLQYTKKRLAYTLPDVFAKSFNLAYPIDLQMMQNKLIDAFNLFVSNNPFEKHIKHMCPKTSSTQIEYRSTITTAEALHNVSITSWLTNYIEIRNLEEKRALDPEVKNLLVKQIKMTKRLDSFQSMKYINNTFRDTYKHKYGGVNYYIQRIKEKTKDVETSTKAISTNTTETTSGQPTTTSVSDFSGGSSGGY